MSLLPLPVLYVFASLSYYLLYYIIGYRKKIVRENLINSFPDKSLEEIIKIEHTFFKFFSALIFEVIKLPAISDKELSKRVKFNNLEIVEAYFERGESLIAYTGHYSNWELGMMALGLRTPGKCYVIYKPLSNPYFESWFYKWRTRTGNIFIPMRQTLRALATSRNQPTMFCFAGDQTPVKGDARHWIDFLNQPTAVLTGVEKIAVQTNRPVIYFNMKLVKKGYYEVDCDTICTHPKDTAENQITKMCFNFLEDIINKDPAYWLWSHRRWKHKPELQNNGA
ncbi:lysophospholipid acyltransferase family protein [Pedobacter metabolipauper]|uniref:lysophospholipid acyltransferase family protein n=1 Tax=Pedobacter metabolipauper TaxID=425513 RepID=UPI001FB7E84A|nr:lysophospholipid acyltransferase family protein [Pedobacter metabolipauper]